MYFQRIRDMREDKNLTLKEFASIFNINYRTYAYYETGERTMPHELLIKIADYFQVSTDYLYERTDNKKINK